MDFNSKLPLRYILTVTELTREIKDILEEKFCEVWVEGEISNLRTPPSGHLYFTLKDDFSQIRVVVFRIQARAFRFLPEDGLHVTCRGRVTLYEKRGDYQLILESMEPKGIGALQLAFLQLKEKLEKEGLFALERKKSIPMVPQRIGIITSPTGAVIRDMLHILQRRFDNVHILLYPARVQGEGAWQEIAQGIEYFNQQRSVDVLIVGRGGGSLEDLWPFNEEGLARAINCSKIPVISAVGHETDYTISDFVADLRAPTPSAAAELVIKDKREVENTLYHLNYRLKSQMAQTLQKQRTRLSHLRKILGSPQKAVERNLLRVDDLFQRLQRLISWTLRRDREKSIHLSRGVPLRNLRQKIVHHRTLMLETQRRIDQYQIHSLEILREKVRGIFGRLDSLNPLSVLQRGYSITRKIPTLQILRETDQVCEGDRVEVQLHRGALICEVRTKKN